MDEDEGIILNKESLLDSTGLINPYAKISVVILPTVVGFLYLLKKDESYIFYLYLFFFYLLYLSKLDVRPKNIHKTLFWLFVALCMFVMVVPDVSQISFLTSIKHYFTVFTNASGHLGIKNSTVPLVACFALSGYSLSLLTFPDILWICRKIFPAQVQMPFIATVTVYHLIKSGAPRRLPILYNISRQKGYIKGGNILQRFTEGAGIMSSLILPQMVQAVGLSLSLLCERGFFKKDSYEDVRGLIFNRSDIVFVISALLMVGSLVWTKYVTS